MHARTRTHRRLAVVGTALLLAACVGDPKFQVVSFSSDPRGATVYVDGEAIGETGQSPIKKKLERERNHTVVFEKAGYYPSTRDILSKPSAFVEGRRSPIDFMLAPSAPKAVLKPENIYTQLRRDPDWRPPSEYEPEPASADEPPVEPEPPTKSERIKALLEQLKRGEISSAEFEDAKNRILQE